MSVLDDYERLEIVDFRGADLLSEATDVAPPWCLSAINVDYSPGNFATRTGYYAHRNAMGTFGPVSSAFNFQYGSISALLWCIDNGSGLLYHYAAVQNAVTPTLVGLGSSTFPGGASYAQWGKFVYVAQYDGFFNSGVGLAIVDMTTGPAFAIWPSFNRPMLTTEFLTITPTVAAGGDVTPGDHVLAIVLQDVTGFVTRPSPIGAILPTPAYPTVTVSTTGQKITVVVTPASTWANWWRTAFLVMTTASNKARLLYVPINSQSIPYGTSTAITFDAVTVPDVILAEQLDIGDLESVATNTIGGSPAFDPYFVFPCGSRMGYFFYQGQIAEPQTYNIAISEPGDPQHITPDRHVFQLPQQRQPNSAVYVQGTLYVFGPNWTYAYTDTGEVPVLWPAPRTVDGKIGTAHPYGASIDSSGFGFVAHRTGLYVFSGGQYEQIPISYYQTPFWNTIDWSELVFNVVIDAERFRVLVFCKMTDGTRKILVWDYTDGVTPKKVKFSVHTLSDSLGVARFGLIMMNRGDAQSSNYRQHLWIAMNTSSIWQLARTDQDATPFLDGTFNIPMTYQMPLLPGVRRDLVHEHHAIELRAIGVGSLRTTSYKLDLTASQTLAVTPLTVTPAKEFTRFLDLRSEGVSHKFQNSTAAGDYVVVSTLRHYHKPYARQR